MRLGGSEALAQVSFSIRSINRRSRLHSTGLMVYVPWVKKTSRKAADEAKLCVKEAAMTMLIVTKLLVSARDGCDRRGEW